MSVLPYFMFSQAGFFEAFRHVDTVNRLGTRHLGVVSRGGPAAASPTGDKAHGSFHNGIGLMGLFKY
jgi:hypothetical protein